MMKRRDFLKTAAVSSFVVNGMPMRPFANRRIAGVLSSCDEVADRVLVLIQLKGGNDGVNTLIPVEQYDVYADLRPVIRIPDTGPERFIHLDNSLPATDRVGVHPVMTGFKNLYEKGWLSIIQGVGYENLNGSHFKSTDLWLTGGDGTPDKFKLRSGWAGRALQAMFPDVKGVPLPPDQLYPLGIQMGDPNPSLGFHTETEHQNSINLYGQDPAGFYTLVQTIGGAPIKNVPDSEYGDELAYIMGIERAVDEYSVYITQAFNAGSNAISNYPQTSLAYQLKTIARLIKGGCKTKIYLCNIGGFDTHGDQLAPEGLVTVGGHGELLRQFSDAMKTFFDDLEGLGLADKVAACSFSEFGRCAKENGSKGTDHGTLAPMFVFGKPAGAGMIGTNVNLSNLTADSQLQGMQFDYRQVFATLLQDWLGASPEVLTETMFETYAKLPLVDSTFVVNPDCYFPQTTGLWDSIAPERRRLAVFPNPASSRTEVSFRSESNFEARLTLHSLGGSLVSGRTVRVQEGVNFFWMDVRGLQAGPYFLRLESLKNGAADVVKLEVVK